MYTFTDEEKFELLAWANELETTKLKQTRNILRNNRNGYCCLGIRLNMVDPTKWKKILENKPIWCYDDEKSISGGNSFTLTFCQREKLFGYNSPIIESDFMILNDNLKYTFKQIAEQIRHLVEFGEYTTDTIEKLLNFK